MVILITCNEHGDYQIGDGHNKWHDRVFQFMLDEHYRPQSLNPSSQMQQETQVWHLLHGECCILAVDEQRNQIDAVAFLKWMTPMWRSWTILGILQHRSKWQEVETLHRHLLDAPTELQPDHPYDGLRLFEYHVSENLRGDTAFMVKFFGTICVVGRHMRMPRVTFVALSAQERAEVEAAGFSDVLRFRYTTYVNSLRLREFRVWRDLVEIYATLHLRELDPLTPYTEMRGLEEMQECMRKAKLTKLGI